MKENYNQEDLQLFEIWKDAAEDLNAEHLSITQMTAYLDQVTTEFGDSLKTTLRIDIILKTIMLFGFIFLCIFRMDNPFVLVTSLTCILFAIISIWQEWAMIDTMKNRLSHAQGLKVLISSKLDFYKSYIWKYPALFTITPAMLYILGSFIYHLMVYGIINPVHDVEDGMVVGGFLLASLVISFGANFPYFKSRIDNLLKLKKDVNDQGLDKDRINKIKSKKRRDLIFYSILAFVGIVVLIVLIVLFLR